MFIDPCGFPGNGLRVKTAMPERPLASVASFAVGCGLDGMLFFAITVPFCELILTI